MKILTQNVSCKEFFIVWYWLLFHPKKVKKLEQELKNGKLIKFAIIDTLEKIS